MKMYRVFLLLGFVTLATCETCEECFMAGFNPKNPPQNHENQGTGNDKKDGGEMMAKFEQCFADQRCTVPKFEDVKNCIKPKLDAVKDTVESCMHGEGFTDFKLPSLEGHEGGPGGFGKDGMKEMMAEVIKNYCPSDFNKTAFMSCLNIFPPHPTGGNFPTGGRPNSPQNGKPFKPNLSLFICPFVNKCSATTHQNCQDEFTKMKGLLCDKCSGWEQAKDGITSCINVTSIGTQIDTMAKMFCDVDCSKSRKLKYG